MADPTANLYAWLGSGSAQTVDRYNELEVLLDEDARFVANGVTIGTSRAAIMAALRSVPGWLSHNTISISANAAFLAVTYRNDYADGTSSFGSAILRFDDAGKVVEVYAMAESARVVDQVQAG